MKTGVTIRGVKQMEAKINGSLMGIKIRSGQGLVRFASKIRRDMETTQPLTPVGDTGLLRASWTQNLTWSGGSFYMRMGFTADYARFVHEFNDKTTNWSRSGSGSRWFHKALERNALLLKRYLTLKY